MSTETNIAAQIAAAGTTATLEEVRVAAFGKNGTITSLMKELGGLDPEARKTRGAELNEIKMRLTEALDTKIATLKASELDAALQRDRVDVTLAPQENGHRPGSLHPITRVMEEMATILGRMGFALAEGPDIEDDFHNFTALNFPPDHPAREMHDTFYLPDVPGQTGLDARRLLRTHTSTMQIRSMEAAPPPHRLMAFGRTYRSDHDQTHSPMFHQMEGLVIDKGIHLGHLKGTLLAFVQNFFNVEGDDILRLRPSFFPFTEPSVEVDIRCDKSGGKLVMGQGDDWMEILGAGMTHPNVLRNCNIDPEMYQGFAFGMGVERLAMLKYGIPDLRTFFESDVRWLQHYGFNPLESVA
jgi:phenylalanyl-tRNA synthetase alpha chain